MLLFVLATFSTYAGGYQVRLQGQKQTGIGLIGTPFAYGSSSIFYNPGALTFTDSKYDIEAGVSLIKSNVTFQKDFTNYQAQTDNPIKPPFYLYGAGKINEQITVGIGVYTPFGSTSQWPDDWAGRYLIQNISLKAIYIQPTISYKVNENFGVGVGLVYATGDVKLQRALPYSPTSQVNLSGKTSSIGFNVGAYYQDEKISAGIDFRSRILMQVEDAEAIFAIPASLQTLVPPTNTFNADLPMPANLDIGIAYKYDEKLTLAAEINYVFWGTYKELEFTFGQNGDLLNSVNPREYSNSLIIRVGGEYILNEKVTLRAGAYYDPSPTHDDYFNPETVSLNTLAFTLGVTYMVNENLEVHATYLQTNGLETEKAYKPNNFSGTYQTLAAIPGFGVRYHF